MSISGHTTIEKLQSIQCLRGIAALLVVLFHCAEIQRAGLPAERIDEIRLLTGFWDQGYAGVDLFFVISGFVIVWVTQSYTRKNIGKFLYNRVTRIYPIWWIFAVIAGLYYFVSYGQLAPPDRYGVENSLSYFLKSLLLIPQESVPVLLVGWTLIHEMFFYLVFAVLLCFPRKYLSLYFGVWAIITLLSFYSGMAKTMASDFESVFASLLTLEFIAGGLLACVLLKCQFKNGLILFGLGAISFMAALIFYTDQSRDMLLYGRVAIYTVPCLLLMAGLITLERNGVIKMPRFLSHLGDWSYSLYLSHILVILAIKRIFQMAQPYLPEALHFQAVGWIDNVVFWLISLTACIVFSALSYRFLERPMLISTRKFVSARSASQIAER